MDDYYKRRLEEAPFNAKVVGVCILLATVIITISFFLN